MATKTHIKILLLIISFAFCNLAYAATDVANVTAVNPPTAPTQNSNAALNVAVSDLKVDATKADDASKTNAKTTLYDFGKAIATSTSSDISSVLLKDRVVSLMYNDKDSQNIDNAITAFKNKQTFSLDGEEGAGADKKDEETAQLAAQPDVLPEQSYIYLASILYISQDAWAVWLNDKKVTSDNNSRKNDFYIMSINRGKVKVRWKLGITKWNILMGAGTNGQTPKTNADNEVENVFELQPNQTFSLKSGKVSEGKVVIDLLSKKTNDVAEPSTDNKQLSPIPAAR